jgi:hypothetical protein
LTTEDDVTSSSAMTTTREAKRVDDCVMFSIVCSVCFFE